jgi:putative ABC transport system permease protein
MLRIDDLLRVSIKQVWRQRRRNLGVVLAVALGTAGLIVIITMGQDVKENINKDLELLGGATVIKLTYDRYAEKYPLLEQLWFRKETADGLRRIPKVDAVTQSAFRGGIALYTKNDRRFFPRLVGGVDQFFWDVFSFSPVAGSFFRPDDVKGRRRVCVLGSAIAKKIFGHEKVTGRLINMDNNLYRITGVLGGVGVGDRNNWVFVPLSTAEDRLPGRWVPEALYVRCRGWEDVKRVAKAIPTVVSAHQPISGLKVMVPWEQLKKVTRMAWWIELFVYLAVAATLILGGFGIWNIMMTGVRDRTREIGLKKAMGAEDKDILSQFLAEALCLSLGAAIVGVVMGRVAIEILASFFESRPREDLFILCVGIGLVFSLALGLGAGIYPSVKASRMEVVSAVRYE